MGVTLRRLREERGLSREDLASLSGISVSSIQKIEIGPLASTMMACVDAALSTQEQQYLEALQLATSYRVTGARLELLRDGGTIAATFEPTPSGG